MEAEPEPTSPCVPLAPPLPPVSSSDPCVPPSFADLGESSATWHHSPASGETDDFVRRQAARRPISRVRPTARQRGHQLPDPAAPYTRRHAATRRNLQGGAGGAGGGDGMDGQATTDRAPGAERAAGRRPSRSRLDRYLIHSTRAAADALRERVPELRALPPARTPSPRRPAHRDAPALIAHAWPGGQQTRKRLEPCRWLGFSGAMRASECSCRLSRNCFGIVGINGMLSSGGAFEGMWVNGHVMCVSWSPPLRLALASVDGAEGNVPTLRRYIKCKMSVILKAYRVDCREGKYQCVKASKCSCTADQPVLEGRTAQSRVALATRGSASLSLSPATRAVEKRNRHRPGTSRGQAWLLYGCDPHALLKELATRGLQPRRQQVVVIPLVQEREGGLRCSIQLRLHLLPRAVRRKVLW